jgi:Fur family zinc uptake transcriptional regulator
MPEKLLKAPGQSEPTAGRKAAGKKRRNHEIVFALLRKAPRPLTAYEILDRLRPEGINAPPTVYRALDRLMKEGLVHRLESLNAFLPCDRPGHTDTVAFAICRYCGRAQEFSDSDATSLLHAWAHFTGFKVEATTVEIAGRCEACRDKTA